MPTFIKTGFWEQTCRTCKGYNGWLNLDDFIGGSGSNGTSGVSGTSGLTGTSGSAGTSGASGTSGSAGTAGLTGSSGTSGVTGTSGLSGDRYKTESVTEFTLGTGGTITVGTGLAFTTAQDIIIAYDSANHQVSMVTSYDSGTGILVFGTPSEVEGTGTFSDWTVNLNGAAGGNGTAGTSGSTGTSGESGTSGLAGTSGSAGTSGATGTNGSSGTSATSGRDATAGTSGSSGVSGSSGTSPILPLPVVYGLYAQTANSTTVTNTTAETTIIGTGVGSLSVPANGFAVGDSFRAILGGVMNANNNQTIRIKLKTGSVILLDSGIQNLGSAVTNDVWSLNVDFTVRQIGAAGVASIVSLGGFHYTKTNNASVQGFGFNVVNTTTFDTTVNNTLDVTIQWGSASTGNNIYSDTFVLNKIY
jgi:hypothetical protein